MLKHFFFPTFYIHRSSPDAQVVCFGSFRPFLSLLALLIEQENSITFPGDPGLFRAVLNLSLKTVLCTPHCTRGSTLLYPWHLSSSGCLDREVDHRLFLLWLWLYSQVVRFTDRTASHGTAVRCSVVWFFYVCGTENKTSGTQVAPRGAVRAVKEMNRGKLWTWKKENLSIFVFKKPFV